MAHVVGLSKWGVLSLAKKGKWDHREHLKGNLLRLAGNCLPGKSQLSLSRMLGTA
jgi:hypothetical protein